MPVEIKVPEGGESITEVRIAKWRKRVGEQAAKDENLVEIESDKATVDLPAPIAGTITQILKKTGDMARVVETIGYMAASSEAAASASPPAAEPPQAAGQTTAASQATVKHAQPAASRVM